MIDKPLLHLSKKTYDTAILILVAIMYIASCAEADMYVPAFPQMIDYFGVNENQIQSILSINFFGLCITCLIAGPLSDSFGRKRILITGLLLFVISSIGCILASNFIMMLAWRFLQGMAASVPIVVGASIFRDKYSEEKAGQFIGFINSLISASTAAGPIIGAVLSEKFSWRANFIAILSFAAIAFFGTLLFIGETLPPAKRRKLNLIKIGLDYAKLLKSLRFVGYCIILSFPFACIVVYVANLSVILVNHMGISVIVSSYYQASTTCIFIIFSLLSIKIIAKKGIEYVKNLGGTLALMGTAAMLYVALDNKASINMILASIAFIAAGGALMASTFSTKILSIFPEIHGTSLAMLNAIRQSMAMSLVVLSEIFFDGTIVPVATIIVGCGTLAATAYSIIYIRNPKAA